MMMDPRAAEYHFQANKGATARGPHAPTTGAPELCVDPSELQREDALDSRQRTQ